MKVLVTHITNLTEARYCAGMEVDFLGFPAGMLEAAQVRDIRAWVVGPSFWIDVHDRTEMLHHPNDEGYILSYPLAADLAKANTLPARWMMRLTAAQVPDLLAHAWRPDYVLLADPAASPSGVITELCQRYPVLIFAEDEEAVARAGTCGAQGIYLLGDDELRPGLRDFDFLSRMFEVLEKAEEEG